MKLNSISSFLIPFLLLVFTLPCIGGSAQNAGKIERFIKKKKITDFALVFSTDSVPENLNLQCRAIMTSSKNKKITVPARLLSKFFRSNDVTINNNGRISLISHHSLKFDTASISIQMANDPYLSRSFKIPVNYRGSLILNFSGKNGSGGRNGENGKPGTATSSRIIDPEKGSDGENGRNGDYGQALYVFIENQGNKANHKRDLITVNIHDSLDFLIDFYKIDPGHSTIIFILNGGKGGDGGNGGEGGHGADGDQGITLKQGQTGALGGKGGNGGNGGNGGQLMVYLNEAQEPVLGRIQIINHGGKGGHGGRMGNPGGRGKTSLYREESVDARTNRELQKIKQDLSGRDGHDGADGPSLQAFFINNK